MSEAGAVKRLLTADPRAGFRAHEREIREAMERVLAGGHYILGPEVAAFEAEFSAYQGGGHTVGVANGTEALELALRAVGVNAGDAVATVANTVTATVAAIAEIGARPVFVEIDAGTMLMDSGALEAVLLREDGAVKAVVPVHLYGQMADMAAICAAAKRHGTAVVEDCAQAHGASIGGRKAGTWGGAAAFSFYPTKNLGALGDGGAVFMRDAAMAERVKLMRQYGWRTRYVAETAGRNSRLDELQAAVLRVKLRYLDTENAQRGGLAARYRDKLAEVENLTLPVARAGAEPVWHQYAVRSAKREALREWLLAREIVCGVLYPVPVHRQPAFADDSLSLPETERACAEVLCLPCHPGLTVADVDRVCGDVVRWRTPS
jgi:aminotransferase EvaB